MKFKSFRVEGKHRGEGLGFPTVNLFVPDSLPHELPPGIYGAWVTIKNKKYKGALFYGPVSTFNEKDSSLEVYLIDAGRINVDPDEAVEVEVVKFIRGVIKFDFPEQLIRQMEKDVEEIEKVLVVS